MSKTEIFKRVWLIPIVFVMPFFLDFGSWTTWLNWFWAVHVIWIMFEIGTHGGADTAPF